MKSALIRAWNHIEIADVPAPTPGRDEALIRLTYCGICGSDLEVYKGAHPTARLPVPMGHEMIGVVECIKGDLPLPYGVGDRVTVHGASCGRCDFCLTGSANQCARRGMDRQKTAGFSEYITAHVDNVVAVPAHLSDRAAALIEPFSVAVRTTDRAGIKPGDTVFVVGGGTIGLVCALTARLRGARRVILSTGGAAHIKTARALGFDVIDRTQTDVAESLTRMTDGRGAQVVIEASGTISGAQITPAAAAYEGTIVMLAVGLPLAAFDVGLIGLKELTIRGSRAHTASDMRRAAHVLGAVGAQYDLDTLISDVVPLDDIAGVFEHMITHPPSGKVLVRLRSSGGSRPTA